MRFFYVNNLKENNNSYHDDYIFYIPSSFIDLCCDPCYKEKF